MLSKAQEKLIKSLHTKKGREKSGLCLVEGQKVIETAGDAIKYTFTPADSKEFANLVTTESPQELAGVARIPEWTKSDIESKPTLLVLDHVQDPGNAGAILRLCLGFDAALLLVNSVDLASPKVIRSSVGAFFHVPFLTQSPQDAEEYLQSLQRPTYRLEKTESAQTIDSVLSQNNIFIAGSEGQGIQLNIEAPSIYIPHKSELESLNVGHALAIVLQQTWQK